MTDDGRPPLAASGLKLHERLERIAASLDRVAAAAGSLPGGLKRLRQLLRRGLEETAALWPPVRVAYRWVKRVARFLENEGELPAQECGGGWCSSWGGCVRRRPRRASRRCGRGCGTS